MNNSNNDTSSEIISWIVIIAAFALFWPVGFFLLIKKLKKYYEGAQAKSSASRAQASAPPVSDSTKKKPNAGNSVGKKRSRTEKAAPVVLLILSIILFFIGALYVSTGFDYLSAGVNGALWEFIRALFYLLGGGAALFCRRRIFKRVRRKKKCATLIGTREVVRLSELAEQLGTSRDVVRGDLEDMIENGNFGSEAYIDIGLDSFVRSFDAAEQERQRRYAADMARDAASAPRGRYETVLEELRNLDDDIEDEAISEKIRSIEDVSAKIFNIVEKRPVKAADARRFMDYYLPTTLKLLRSYATLERQGISGENISNAKNDIDRILDTLVNGFHRQLDQLFRTEAIDISADIEVLESMMKNDGLTGESPFMQQPSH